MLRSVRPSVPVSYVSLAQNAKRYGYYRTLVGNPVLEVEPTGHMATGSGHKTTNRQGISFRHCRDRGWSGRYPVSPKILQ